MFRRNFLLLLRLGYITSEGKLNGRNEKVMEVKKIINNIREWLTKHDAILFYGISLTISGVIWFFISN